MQPSELEEHLLNCNDTKAHAAHRRGVERAAAAAAGKAAVKEAEAEAQNLMAWQYLGGGTEQMWLLTDTQLKLQLEDKGLQTCAASSREEMLVTLAQHQAALDAARDGVRRIGDGRTGSSSGGGSGNGSGGGGGGGGGGGEEPATKRGRAAAAPRPRLSAASLPSNLHSLSLSQLRSVCASHGMLVKGATTEAVIAEIEAVLYSGTEAAPLLLE